MAAYRRCNFGLLGAALALAACEPSLIGDFNTRGANGAGTAGASSGGAGGTSPRWSANNPQPATPPVNTTRPANNAATASTPPQTPPPWNGAAQPGATISQGGVAAVQPGPVDAGSAVGVTPPTAGVCEDNRPRALELPGETCARPCRATWQRCYDRCGNGQDRACVAACDDAFRDCMRGCY
jgi:hypothetical protein